MCDFDGDVSDRALCAFETLNAQIFHIFIRSSIPTFPARHMDFIRELFVAKFQDKIKIALCNIT